MTSNERTGPRFLPVGLERLLGDLSRDVLPPEQRGPFERFGRLWVALFHLRMRADLLGLRRLYTPFDPDLELMPDGGEIDRGAAKRELEQRLRGLLERAHFTEATREDLNRALTKISPHGLAVSVDLNQLDLFALYYRGVQKRTLRRRDPKRLWLGWMDVEQTIFRRVVLLIEAKGDGGAGGSANKSTKRSTGDAPRMDPRHVYLKLFKDVPFSDLEMLLPNTKVRMTLFDKVRIGVTGGGGTLGGIMATVTKLGAAASPTTWAVALGGLGAVIWRQLSKVFNQRTKYMATLAQRLYFHTLDNGFGVLTRLVESAEEEECKETLLAAAQLVQSEAADAGELDRRAEAWIRKNYDLDIDYDVGGGVAKLREAGVLEVAADSESDGEGAALRLRPLPEATRHLDAAWDAVFEPHATEA